MTLRQRFQTERGFLGIGLFVFGAVLTALAWPAFFLSKEGVAAGPISGTRLRSFPSTAPSTAPVAPSIVSLLKPEIYKSIQEDRGPQAHAKLEDGTRYRLYSAMIVGASPKTTREVLTDYRHYSKIIPYVEKADFSEKDQLLRIAGGIWRYRLESVLKFEERSPGWIAFRIIDGHFRGLQGEFLFEPYGERGTLVYLRGELEGKNWPPTWIIERGAEVVFRSTANKLRSYIEDKGKPHVHQTPR